MKWRRLGEVSPPASGAADAVFIKICIYIYIYITSHLLKARLKQCFTSVQAAMGLYLKPSIWDLSCVSYFFSCVYYCFHQQEWMQPFESAPCSQEYSVLNKKKNMQRNNPSGALTGEMFAKTWVFYLIVVSTGVWVLVQVSFFKGGEMKKKVAYK